MTEQALLGGPLVSVIVPHRNQLESLEHCLQSLDRQALSRALFEVIVVDNGSQTSPEPVIARHPGASLLFESEPGPGPARTRGVLSAKGSILAFIDADCRADAGWLTTVSDALRDGDEGVIIGGDVRIWRHQGSRLTALEAYESVFAYRFELYIKKHGYSGTGNLAMRRKDFDKVGGFAGISVAEDIEWGRRARAAGLRFEYVPAMIVYHPARASFAELCLKWRRHVQHNLNEARGKSWWKVRWISRSMAVLLSALPDALTVLMSNRIQGTASRVQAIGVLVAIRAYRTWTMFRILGASDEVVWNRTGAPDDLKANLSDG